MRMVGMYPPFTRFEETEARINKWANEKEYFAIVLKEIGVLIGYIAIHPDSEKCREDTRELGFALISKYMRKAMEQIIKRKSLHIYKKYC